MMRDFHALLESRFESGRMLCIGLDPDLEKIPTSVRTSSTRDSLIRFNKALIDATHELVCAFKPNSAFYEAYGLDGLAALKGTIDYIHAVAPDVPVILDAKRADIGNTNNGYIAAAFEYLEADAITVHPYLGREALLPLLARKEKGIIVLCRTSNQGAGEFQDLLVDGEPLYRKVARAVAREWNSNGNCAVVVGATYPEELKEVRALVGDMPILIPGIGAQGGDIQKTIQAGRNSNGRGMIISASRAVIFASSGSDFAEAARAAAEGFDAEIRRG